MAEKYHVSTNLLNFSDLMLAPAGKLGSTMFDHLLELTLKPNTTYILSSNGYGSTDGNAGENR